MQIVCPNCTTAYDVPAAKFGGEGRSVRCARCRTVWVATAAPEPVKKAAPAAAMVAAAEPRGAASNAPPAEEFPEAGEFDWSIGSAGTESDAPAPGEDPAETGGGAAATQDDIDAMWSAAAAEPIDQAPPLVPAMLPEAEPAPAAQPESIEAVAARRAGKGKSKKRGWTMKLPRPGMAAAIVALVAILGSAVLARSKIVQFAPQTASLFSAIGLPVNLRGLVFENVRTTGEVHEGVPVLIVEGTIANVTDKTVEVPRLRFAMRNRGGQEIYAWTSVTGRSILAPGETATFRTRHASPPAEGREVVVRFFHKRDFLAGMR